MSTGRGSWTATPAALGESDAETLEPRFGDTREHGGSPQPATAEPWRGQPETLAIHVDAPPSYPPGAHTAPELFWRGRRAPSLNVVLRDGDVCTNAKHLQSEPSV